MHFEKILLILPAMTFVGVLAAPTAIDVASSIVEREAKPAVNAKRADSNPDAFYTYNFNDDAAKDKANPAVNAKRADAKRTDANPDAFYTYNFKDDAAKQEANPAVNAKREKADPDEMYLFQLPDDDAV